MKTKRDLHPELHGIMLTIKVSPISSGVYNGNIEYLHVEADVSTPSGLLEPIHYGLNTDLSVAKHRHHAGGTTAQTLWSDMFEQIINYIRLSYLDIITGKIEAKRSDQ